MKKNGCGRAKKSSSLFSTKHESIWLHVMAHMITLDEEYLEKGLLRTCIRTGVQQTREKNIPGRGTLRRLP